MHIPTHHRTMDVAICTIPLMGHLIPLIPLAAELQRQGHSVTFFHDAAPKYRRKIDSSMPTNTSCKSVTYYCEKDGSGPGSWSQALYETVLQHYQTTKHTNETPDILVYDFFAVDAADAADQMGNIPSIGVFPNPRSVNPWAATAEQQESWQWKAWRKGPMKVMEGILARVLWMMRSYTRKKRGLPMLPEQDIYPSTYMPRSMIGVYAPELEFNNDDDASSPLYEMVGPSLPPVVEAMDADLQAWVDQQIWNEVPIVYIAFGTMYQHTRESVQRMERELLKLQEEQDVAVLWSLPTHQQQYLSLSQHDSNNTNWKIANFLPQVALLQSGAVAAFVTHCGSNSVSEAVLTGIPMVCCPGFADQPANAARIANKGIGVICDIKKDKSKGNSLSSALREVLADGSFRQRSQAMSKAVAARNGAKRAADIILQTARDGVQPMSRKGRFPIAKTFLALGVAAVLLLLLL